MVRVGMVGFGEPSKVFHLPLFKKAGLSLAAVASSRPDAVKAEYPSATVHPTPAALFADPSVELVVIASPSYTHADLVLQAIEAGKNVITDKPFCHTVAQADAIIAARDKAGVIATVFQNRRWDSDFLTFSKLINDGTLGRIQSYRGHFEFFAPTTPGGDAPNRRTEPTQYGLGTHQVDQVYVLFGKPDWVFGDLQRIEGGENPDRMRAILGYDAGPHEGLRVELFAGFTVPDNRARYAIHGTKGSYIKSFMDCQEGQLASGIVPDDPAYGREPEERWAELTRVLEDGSTRRETVPSVPGDWSQIYSLLAEAVRTGGAPPVSAEEARDVIAIINAIERSNQEGRRVAP